MTPCWVWDGAVNDSGYGMLSWRGRRRTRAHRLAYELCNGAIPKGMVLHHRCGVRACVNPAHLTFLPQGEHARKHLSRTTCWRGHAQAENYVMSNGHRRCRVCRNIAYRAWYARQRNP